MVKGIAPHFAIVLVKVFRENAFTIIENEPDSLPKLLGLSANGFTVEAVPVW